MKIPQLEATLGFLDKSFANKSFLLKKSTFRHQLFAVILMNTEIKVRKSAQKRKSILDVHAGEKRFWKIAPKMTKLFYNSILRKAWSALLLSN